LNPAIRACSAEPVVQRCRLHLGRLDDELRDVQRHFPTINAVLKNSTVFRVNPSIDLVCPNCKHVSDSSDLTYEGDMYGLLLRRGRVGVVQCLLYRR
jgi:hypothetical protein